jgi:hypothetical protein
MALRAPWYALVRGGLTRFDPEALQPTLQKYDLPDFVERLLRDPRDSLRFGREDRWSFSAPITPQQATTIRERFAGRRTIGTPLRKLYLPSHQRYYAVTVELFCDIEGLPRPGVRDDVTVEFVVRRLSVVAGGEKEKVQKLAVALAKLYADRDVPEPPTNDSKVSFDGIGSQAGEDVIGFGSTIMADLAAIEAHDPGLVAAAKLRRLVEGWYIDAQGIGSWQPVPIQPGDPIPAGTEERLPMWQLPASAAQCDTAHTRSLWFGLIPTTSGDLDFAGQPKLSERHLYHIQCIATKQPGPGREHCPPLVRESAPTQPYRLAAFFDPAGTAQRKVRVRLPDLNALMADAANPSRPQGGGIEFERPPGSQLPMQKFATIPDTAGAKPEGDTSEFCTFAIELITIVASFVLALFMPVVILVFQLWWMLLLKFCWPPSDDAQTLIDGLGANDALDSLPPLSPQIRQRKVFAEMAGFPFTPDVDVVAEMKATRADLTSTQGTAKEIAESLAPENPPELPVQQVETIPNDPLCPPEIEP